MKIGSFLPLQSNPGKQPGQTPSLPNPALDNAGNASDKSSGNLPQALVQAIDSAEALTEFMAAAEQTVTSEAKVFNLDRELPLSTQNALSAYVTTEAHQAFSKGELVGVDLYV